MNNKGLIAVIVILLGAIGYLAWMLYANPAPVVVTPNPAPAAPSPSPSQVPITKPVVTSPASGATVGKTFTVTGQAPGAWYFEAVFPVQVRDKDNNKIGQGQAQAQGDWMQAGPVRFTATISTSGYSGPATLVLLKDNPSGLPQNDDSVEIPIIIQ